VQIWRPGEGDDDARFFADGRVTLANVQRAKGNEAWKVYATRLHYTTQPLGWKSETELHKRNELFACLTRARAWCVATGQESPVFEELRRAVDMAPELTFLAFNRSVLRRVLGDESAEEGGEAAG
jgi:superfamily I DNA and RNA helicase